MNIFYLVNEFPKLSETFILNEIYELENRGHDITVFSLRDPDSEITHKEYQELDAKICYLPSLGPQTFFRGLRAAPIGRELLDQLRMVGSYRSLAVLYAAGWFIQELESTSPKPDVIHSHFLDWSKFVFRYVRQEFDIPITTTAHAFDIFREGTDRQRQFISGSLDRLVTISEYNKRYLREEVGVKTPIEVVRMGIRPEKFTPQTENVPNRLLTVGRFVEKKGIEYAIRGVADIAPHYPDLEYHIIGGGPKEDEYRKLIRTFDLEDVVTILGRVSDERLITELDQASLFVLTCVVAKDGDRDGIPVALMEAMAMRCVPVSTSVSGIPELIADRESGILVSPREKNLLVERVKELLRDSELQTRFTEKAQKTVLSDFTVENQVADLERVFRQIQH